MKNLYLLFAIIQLSQNSFSQQGQWTWMNGSDTGQSRGHYGTKGIYDSLNTPPGLYEPCEWTDNSGSFGYLAA